MNIDILILTYNSSNKISFEYLKTFYYLYYNNFEEKDKPKNIILIDFGYSSKDIDKNSSEALKKLFNGNFYIHRDNEDKLDKILKECIENLKNIYNYTEYFDFFNNIKLNNFFVLVYGDKELQNNFINLLFENCNLENKKILENIYEVKFNKIINGDNLNFKIRFKLMESGSSCYNSICNILLYDTNNKNSYKEIKKVIREYIMANGAKYKQIFNLFSLNSNSTLISDKNSKEIKKGKKLADELGANFSLININNNINIRDEIKNKFDKLLKQIEDNINKSKTEKQNEPNIVSKKNNIINYVELKNCDFPLLYVNEINNKIKNNFKEKINFLVNNICPICYENMSVKIDETLNIIIIYCNKCKSEPRGLNINQYNIYNKTKNKFVHCHDCQKVLNYDFKEKKLSCICESEEKYKNVKKKNSNKKIVKSEKIIIPCFLKDTYCYIHNKFHKHYMKYSKKGLCQECKEEKKNNYFIENFNEEEINNLIKQKKLELDKELSFINSLQNKFNKCINSLLSKFEMLIEDKIKMHMLKSELINILEVIQNNFTIISNVNSLKFDLGEKFTYNEDDSIENKINNIFNYLNNKSDINNFNFGKNNDVNNLILNGPFNNLKSIKDTIITDICGVNNNKLICISFNDGQAKIYDLNINEKNSYPKCIIKEFLPNQGVNSIYVSKEDNIWKMISSNKNELIYLNGFEEIKLIQMNHNYDSYDLLYTITDDSNNINNSVEIDYNNILILNNFNIIKSIYFNKGEDKKIKNEIKDITNLLISEDKMSKSLQKISENIISLTLTNNNNFKLSIIENEQQPPLENTNSLGIKGYLYSKDEPSFDMDDYFTRQTIVVNNETEKEKEKYVKIFYLNKNTKNKELNLKNNSKKNDGLIKVKKEFTFGKNFNLLGSISNDDNLLLLNYIEDKKNSENIFYIFDFNIFQFVNVFKFHNIWRTPVLFEKKNYEILYDKNGFIICDEDLNIIQYFYDKNYQNKIYYINISKVKKRTDKKPVKFICLDNKIILLCHDSQYYLLNT